MEKPPSMLKPNADSGYIRLTHDSLGLVCSGSFLQLSLFYIIHRLPIHNDAGSLLSLPLWSFFPDQEHFALCSSHLLPFRYYSSDSTPSTRFFQLKTKVQMLKNTRDYSFLLSDDAELLVTSRGSLPHKAFVANSALPPSTKQSSSNTGRKLLDDRVVRKPILGSSQMPHQLLSQKSVFVSKQTQLALDSRKQLGSSKGSGPDWPLGVQPKIIGSPNGKRVLTPGVKSTVPALHKPTSSKLQPSIPRQYLVQKKKILQSGKSKVMPQQAEPSYKHKSIMQKQAVPLSNSQQLSPKNATRFLEDRRRARKLMRHEEEEDDGAEAISMIRRMFRYNPNRYQDEDDTSDMKVNFDDILKEEKQSAKIAKKEDEEELRKIEEEEMRERLRKQSKKRKLSH